MKNTEKAWETGIDANLTNVNDFFEVNELKNVAGIAGEFRFQPN